MKNKDKIFDDMARMAGGTVNVFGGLTRNIKSDIQSRTDDIAARLDLVPREDFERLETMLIEARSKQEDQEKRIQKLEDALSKKAKK
jgi:BMFP domain-containing protein YqiC